MFYAYTVHLKYSINLWKILDLKSWLEYYYKMCSYLDNRHSSTRRSRGNNMTETKHHKSELLPLPVRIPIKTSFCIPTPIRFKGTNVIYYVTCFLRVPRVKHWMKDVGLTGKIIPAPTLHLRLSHQRHSRCDQSTRIMATLPASKWESISSRLTDLVNKTRYKQG